MQLILLWLPTSAESREIVTYKGHHNVSSFSSDDDMSSWSDFRYFQKDTRI